MPRKPTRDGRRVHVNIRVSEPEAALLDSVRGELRRGPWMCQAALEAAHRLRDSGIRESMITPGEGKTEVRSFALAPEEAAPASPRKPRAKGPCEHRVRPGSYCRRCDRLI